MRVQGMNINIDATGGAFLKCSEELKCTGECPLAE